MVARKMNKTESLINDSDLEMNNYEKDTKNNDDKIDDKVNDKVNDKIDENKIVIEISKNVIEEDSVVTTEIFDRREIRCGIIIINYDQINGNHNFVVVKGRKSRKYSFPKGHMEVNDNGIFGCALRETFEEVGNKMRNLFRDYDITENNMIRIKVSKFSYYFICIIPMNVIDITNINFYTKDKREISGVSVIPLRMYAIIVKKKYCNLDMRLFYEFYLTKINSKLSDIRRYYRRIIQIIKEDSPRVYFQKQIKGKQYNPQLVDINLPD